MLRFWLPIIFILLSLSTQAQTIWGAAAKGMSPAQVIEAVELAHLVEDGGKAPSGAVEMVRVDNVVIANESFKVSFFFTDQKLVQVNLIMDTKNYSPATSDPNLIYSDIEAALKVKYGKEISSDKEASSIGRYMSASWVSDDKVMVTLFLDQIGDFAPRLGITYRTQALTESKNL